MEKLASSAIDGAVSIAKSAVVAEVALQLGVNRDLEFIKNEFQIMQTFLVASNEEHSKDPVARVWGRQARDLAYDVEDYIEDFAIHLGGKTWWWFSPTKIWRRHKIGSMMKDLRARVQDASNRRALYYSFVVAPAPAEQPEPAFTIGRNGSKPSSKDLRRSSGVDQLINKLLLTRRNNSSLMVVSICVGTTMTPLIGDAYDKLAMIGRFGTRAWVTVIRPFNLMELIRSLIRQFNANASSQEDHIHLDRGGEYDQDLTYDLSRKYTTRVSYLLVLDGISTREEWDSIKGYLGPNANNASCIIATSQRDDVARYCTGGLRSTPFWVSDGTEVFPAFCNMEISADGPAEFTSSASNPENIASTSSEIIEVDDVDEMIQNSNRAMASVDDETLLVGQQKETDWLRSKLVRDAGTQNNDVTPISICGLSGIGKTALVLNVYHRQDVIKSFQCRAWITLSSPVNEEELLQSLLRQFKSDHPTSYRGGSLQEIRTELVEFYKMMSTSNHTAKCLLVFDRVSTRTEWNFLVKSCSISEEYKSLLRIIITTRELQLANSCSNNNDEFVYSLSSLHENDATKLFRLEVFGQYNNIELRQDMVEQENHILQACGGIPSAVIDIGRHLASKPCTVREWEKARKNFDLQQLEGSTRTTMEASYDSLSYHVKYCFVYLSIFQEDVSITRRRLVKRWIAEGYMNGMQGPEADKHGEMVFNELLSKTIMQPTRYAGITSGRVTSCSVHPLMLQLSTSKAQEEKLVCILEDHNRDLALEETIRHVVVRRSWRRDHKDEYRSMDRSRVRSLTVFGEWRPFLISKKMRMLRVLDLEGVEGLTGHDLRKIGKFRHLKYLGLRNTRIEHMPKSLGMLKFLGTLDIRYTNVRTLPSTIVNLKRLRVLRGGSRSLQVDNAGGISNGDPWGVTVRKEMGKLRALNTLGTVSIRNQSRLVVQELRKLTELHKLSVTGITDENGPDLCSTLQHLSRLQSLALHSPSSPAGLSGSLRFPLANLQVLKIHGHLPVLPPWISGLRNLFKLYLHNTRIIIDCHDLDRLPNLTKLLLLADSIIGPQLIFETDGFKELELLELSNLTSQEVFSFKAGTMPKLKTLHVSGCSNLKDFSVDEGSMAKLECLSVEACDSLRSLSFERGGERRSMPMMKSFQVGGCDNLRFLGFLQGDMPKLETITLRCCKNLLLRFEAEAMPALKDLQIFDCQNLELLTQGVPLHDGQEISSRSSIEEGVMPNLETLKTECCHELQGLLFGCRALPKLESLLIKDCSNLEEVAFSLGTLPKLATLEISGCPRLTESAVSGLQDLNPISKHVSFDAPANSTAEEAHPENRN